MRPLRRNTSTEWDRILAGKAADPDSGLDDVADFVQTLKAAHLATPAPEVESAHLAAIMKEVEAATADGRTLVPDAQERPPPGSTPVNGWRRAVLRGAGTSLAIKMLGGAVALAGTAGGLAALEVLPDPAQRHVATAVEAVTPFELPGNPEARKTPARPTLQIEEVPESELPPAAGSPDPNAGFGQSVAEDARDGGVEGAQISERARQEAERRREEGQAHRPREVQPGGPDDVPGVPQGVGPPGGGPASGAQNGMERAGETPAGQGPQEAIPPAAHRAPSR